MSAALHLAKPTDLEKLTQLVAAFHAEIGISSEETARERALIPMLDGSPYGIVYLIGPTRAPIGYIAITFSWSIEFGGMIATLDEFYVRPQIRGRGIGTEALLSLRKTLAQSEVNALFLEVQDTDGKAKRLYQKAGFGDREGYQSLFTDL
ncbi:MAG: GNAT family N-acetyltransferase [Pseudomonadota bacterium]|nr:GNAT family N-acetyltransferase [Pseudomonadota bacterium]